MTHPDNLDAILRTAITDRLYELCPPTVAAVIIKRAMELPNRQDEIANVSALAYLGRITKLVLKVDPTIAYKLYDTFYRELGLHINNL